ncbi:MAG: hypothetical protein A3C35_08005 [Omnitrophica bacterium RIFCSPHIGHO2_02_FULL_46_11]|nr:MAG: hypothetical protein A3A81_01985 [Omnitrophica bacterium RIFCSPLOWO2_01_FULL_45_10b]OGW86497.1 MAG: hypothetical protein A3C35_08005 [Omnitrophica bacterium RIFCSPHIGHO2_02_FULL_46_11]
MAKSNQKPGLAKFFQDYPIVLVVAVSLGIGIWFGYYLAHRNPAHPKAVRNVLESKGFKKNAFADQIPSAGVPIVPFQKFFEKSKEEEKIQQPIAKPLGKPKIVFVIDDIGYNKKYADLLFSISPSVTCAILPQVAYSKYFAEEAKQHGFETILHIPLEPESAEDEPGPGLMTVNMSSYEVKAVLDKDLASVPGVTGANNHMGSRATRDRALMYFIVKELKARQLFFLDSMTHPDSVGHDVAHAMGLTPLKRDVFLDNQDDFDYVTERIQETAQIAKQMGVAVAIGHYRENTLSAIKKAMPGLQADGIEIVRLQDLK